MINLFCILPGYNLHISNVNISKACIPICVVLNNYQMDLTNNEIHFLVRLIRIDLMLFHFIENAVFMQIKNFTERLLF